MPTLYDFDVVTIEGGTRAMTDFAGAALLIVNVASRCGFTPQYRGLEALHRKFSGEGFFVLGFPCNQFGRQEPGSNAEIAAFCAQDYGVTFPIFAKIDVNGANAHPLFRHLKSAAPGLARTAAIKWNFTKFLVDRAGRVVRRYAPIIAPRAIERDVVALL